jgi:hypothetical protein
VAARCRNENKNRLSQERRSEPSKMELEMLEALQKTAMAEFG